MSDRSTVHALGLTFKNPIIVASTDIARSLDSFEAFAKSGVGGIITKSVTDATALQNDSIARIHITDMKQREVHGEYPEDYYFFSRGGSMLSMRAFKKKAPQLVSIAKANDVIAIGSISACRLENWIAYAKDMEAFGFDAIELNFGNPHGEAANGKLGFLIGQSPELGTEIVTAVKKAVNIPVIVKLTPQISDLVSMAQAMERAGADAVTIMHRFQGLMIDEKTDEPILGGWAAIGGPWMKPISLANVAKVYRGTNLTILGGNGADTPRDILDFILCGAKLIEVGSSMMLRGPEYAKGLVQALDHMLEERNASCEELAGKTAKAIVTYKNLDALPQRHSEIKQEICDNCKDRVCLETCYFGGLEMIDGKFTHDTEQCSGCGLCVHTCPENAVEIKYTEVEE